MTRTIDLTGLKFGKLTVLENVSEGRPKGTSYWRCSCECGKETVVRRTGLVLGRTRSCGCLRKEKCGRPRLRSKS